MNKPDFATGSRVADLAAAFDRSFAEAPAPPATAAEGMLTLRLGTDPYAVRQRDVSGLFADRRVTWFPSDASELLGLAGFRGTLLPVFDLGMLLGRPKAAGALRWLVVTAELPVGLAFDTFDGYVTASKEAIVEADGTTGIREGYVHEILHAEAARPVIHLPAILETVRRRSGQGGRTRPA